MLYTSGNILFVSSFVEQMAVSDILETMLHHIE